MTGELKELVGYPVNRGIKDYAEVFGKTPDGLLSWLKNKRVVLDISSGGGLLKKEIDILRMTGQFTSDVKIIPLDIIYATKEGVDFAKYATHMAFTELNIKPTREMIASVNSSFTRNAVGASFTDLPFQDETFDGILASYSFGVHAKDRKQILQAYGELNRVLKPGAQALVSVIFDKKRNVLTNYDKNNPFTYSLDDLEFDEANIRKNGIHSYLDIKK